MGHPQLRSNKPFPHHRCTRHQHCAHRCTPHCPPSQRGQGTIYSHLHPRPARSPSGRTSSPYHPRPGIPLPSLCCHHHADICKIPQDRTVTYTHIVIDHRPQKEDPNRFHITVGGNLIDYPFELTTCTANMVSSKILWNSVISTKDARFAGADIKNIYLKTPLD